MSHRECMRCFAAALLVFLGPGLCSGAEPATGEVRTPMPRWLLLGPVDDPLPVFHDESPGSVDVQALAQDPNFDLHGLTPAEGDEVAWFDGSRTAWRVVRADASGTVTLETAARQGRAAFLAAALAASQFGKIKIELSSPGSLGAWLDGSPVELQGERGRTGSLRLTPGKHWLVVKAHAPDSEENAADSAPWTIKASLLADQGGSAALPDIELDARRGVSLPDILDAPRITSLAVSADGSLVAASYRRTLPGSDETEGWVEVRQVEPPRIRATFRGFRPGQVAWTGRGHELSYVTDAPGAEKDGGGAAPERTVWVADLDSGRAVPLLENVKGLQGVLWARDGSRLAYWVEVPHKKDDRGVQRLTTLRDRRRGFRDRSYLYLYDRASRASRRLTAGSLDAEAQDFSPDGTRVLFTRQVDDVSRRPYVRTEIWEVDLRRWKAKKLRDAWWFVDAQYAPDGRRILVQGGPSAFDGAGRNLPEGMVPNDYDHQLYLWDPATGGVDAITREFDPAVRQARWCAKDGNLYLLAEEKDYVRLFRYDPRRRSFTRIPARFEALEGFDVSSQGLTAVATGTSPWITQGMVAVNLKRDEARVIAWSSADWFEAVERGTVEPWNFTASDGRTIEGRIYLPPGFDPSAKYPAIVYYYGGVSPTGRNFGGRYPKEYWASLGYVVYVLQPAGATGFGQAFSALHVNDWGKIVSREILDGVDKFLEAHPYVDPERVGCIGASYGGFMTMTLLTQSDRFAAAVAHAGISNIASYWGEGYWGFQYNAVSAAESFPWNRRDLYVERSPLYHAEKIETPLLLTHGTSDVNVPVGESETLFTALRLLGAPVEYVRVFDEDHWIVDLEKRRVWSETIAAWFDRWLKGQPEWWQDLYPEGR